MTLRVESVYSHYFCELEEDIISLSLQMGKPKIIIVANTYTGFTLHQKQPEHFMKLNLFYLHNSPVKKVSLLSLSYK